MRVLVTGGAGFIGSHLVDALLKCGHEVTVLDDLSSGSKNNIKHHAKNPSFRFVRSDIREARAVERAMGEAEAVIHEAAMVSVPRSISNPELSRSVNVDGTVNLLKRSLKLGIKCFVYASSCAVYGEQEKLPISEEAKPNPLSPYASSKLEAEQSCLAFHKREGLETICLRYFNVYGPRQSTGEYAGVMVKFIERLRNGQPPVIYGSGRQTRDFVHVSDAVRATLLALERDGVVGEVINVGTGRATSILELCGMFLKAAGRSGIEPVYEKPRIGDLSQSQADISKARKLLGYEPKISLEQGVGELLKEF